MKNSNENHWQNRVRFARRQLVDAGIIGPSEHGRWQLSCDLVHTGPVAQVSGVIE
jgi:hypothetical protein